MNEFVFGGESLSGIINLLEQDDFDRISYLIDGEDPSKVDMLVLELSVEHACRLVGEIDGGVLPKIISSLSSVAANKVFSGLSPASVRKLSGSLDKIMFYSFYRCLTVSNRKILRALVSPDLGRFLAGMYSLTEGKPPRGSRDISLVEPESTDELVHANDDVEYQKYRADNFSADIEKLTGQISNLEASLAKANREKLDTQHAYVSEVSQLKDSIKALEERHQKELQQKIETKVPVFVKAAIEALEKKETFFSSKASSWNRLGHGAMILAMVSSVWALLYGAELFRDDAAKDSIDWFFFGFLLLKGLILISLFAAFAKHAYTVANAYVHESLKRSDRTHAINFGKLYLEVYGNDVTQADMKSVFENWNLDSDSAFLKIKTGSFEPRVVGQVTQLIDSISKATTAKTTAAKSDKPEKSL